MFHVDPDLVKAYRESVDLTNFPKEFVAKWYERASEDEKTNCQTAFHDAVQLPT